MDINWNSFKAKFNGKEQKTFEWLCYLLFCKEFNKPVGIFRYKNQAGIETEPIEYDNQLIGFQSKFYETSISSNKKDIIDSISKAKDRNPKLDKILFYINQEFSESSKKKKKEPQYKIEIEEHAENLNIEIEWRVRSHLEIQLADPSNKSLAQYCFSSEKSSVDFINELIQHTESFLRIIRSKIIFHDSELKIDRSSLIQKIRDILSQTSIVVLTGEGGTGKTAIIKDFHDTLKDKTPFFVFKATEFNVTNINQLFANYGSFTLLDFMALWNNLWVKIVGIAFGDDELCFSNTPQPKPGFLKGQSAL